MKIKLVKNGVFPIIYDKNGNRIAGSTATEFPFAGTIQGEGKLIGTSSLFIRLSGCNLRCMWENKFGELSICDTPYASFSTNEVEEWAVDDVVKTIMANQKEIRHIVITGGEPTLQEEAVSELAMKLKKLQFHITLETNGVYFSRNIANYIDLFSISPKLNSSVPNKEKLQKIDVEISQESIDFHRDQRVNINTLQHYIDLCYQKTDYYGDFPASELKRKSNKDFQLKFVVSSDEEVYEIKKDFLGHLKNVRPEDVVLMPLGKNKMELEKTSKITARMAIENSWSFSPRLQIDLFGDVAGT